MLLTPRMMNIRSVGREQRPAGEVTLNSLLFMLLMRHENCPGGSLWSLRCVGSSAQCPMDLVREWEPSDPHPGGPRRGSTEDIAIH